MHLELIRFAYKPDATLGWLVFAGQRVATLEEPWRPDPDGPGGQRREGALKESCIPDGDYRLVQHSGARFKNVWALVNPALGVYRWESDIPAGQKYGRSAILIHSGNSTDNIEGCVLVGKRHGINGGRDWLYESLNALDLLRAKLHGDDHTITIRPCRGTAEVAC